MVAAFSLPGFCNIPNEDDDDIVETKEPVSGEIVLSTEHDPCFAHTIQPVVKDGLKDAGPLSKVLGKVSSLVSHVRRSCLATELLEDENRLQPSNATRWNSQIVMIKST